MVEEKINKYKHNVIFNESIGIFISLTCALMLFNRLQYPIYQADVITSQILIAAIFIGFIFSFYGGWNLIKYIAGKVFLELIEAEEAEEIEVNENG